MKKTSKISIVTIVILAAMMLFASCSAPRCGYMKCYNRDVRMGIAR